jgi:hypothetical protein
MAEAIISNGPAITAIATESNSAQQQVLVDAKGEHWVYSYWRPAMAWQYMAVCIFDFILAPIMLTFYSTYTHTAYIQWHPLSLEGGGLYHLAMGAVLGITSWSRGQEKLKEMSVQ